MQKTLKIISTTLIAVFLLSGFEASAATGTKKVTSVYVTQPESEKRVREYFKDIPVMIEIARCESNFRQYTDAGNVLRGGDSGGMVGVFQFFESIHATPALALGFDITTLEGNLGYAKYVYEREGTAPWDPAKYCWNILPTATEKSQTANTTIAPTRAELLKQIATLTTLIKQLQRKLEQKKRKES